MGKRKKSLPKQNHKSTSKSGIYASALGSDDETLYRNETDDDDNDDLFNDEIDNFHKERDSNLLKKSALTYDTDSDDDESDNEEEVMAIDSDDDDDDDDTYGDDKLSKFKIEYQKEQMASDLDDDDDDDDDDDGVPDSSAWGKKRSTFYNTDYVDKDFRSFKPTDEELAKYEEEEAMAIQKRLLEAMSNTDMGIKMIVGDNEPIQSEKPNEEIGKDDDEERLIMDVSLLSKREKLRLLKTDSPELQPLINDFQQYMNEIKHRLEPLMTFIRNGKIKNKNVKKYITMRYQLIMHYFINISFYFTLKSKRASVKDHPVIMKLLTFKKLITELDTIATGESCSLNNDIEIILQKLNRDEMIEFQVTESMERNEKEPNNKKKVKFADVSAQQSNDNESVKLENNEIGKRGITYEMAKNKGLTPKRKKELRNPRVKHRMKFQKAKVRRKGAVREPRKELKKYGGEISGIRSKVVKSIKFK